ncbi:MAG: hypothetical protein AB7I41_01775 [Candidatus Sericytochromatia bacterium]
MWRCSDCGEKNEGAYQSCWQCEARKDGRPKQRQEALKASLGTRFICRCCGQNQAMVKDQPQLCGVISASCSACSYTELYQTDILMQQGQVALDLLFGSSEV